MTRTEFNSKTHFDEATLRSIVGSFSNVPPPRKLSIFVLILLSPALAVAAPLFLKNAINLLINDDIKSALEMLLCFILLNFFSRAAATLLSLNVSAAWRGVRRELLTLSFDRILCNRHATIQNRTSAEQYQIVMNGASGLRSLLESLIVSISPTIIQLIIILCVVIANLDLVICVIFGCFVFIYCLLFLRFVKVQATFHRNAVDTDIEMSGVAADSLNGKETALLFCSQKYLIERIERYIIFGEKKWLDLNNAQSIYQIILSSAISVTLIITFSYIVYLISIKQASIGDLVLANMYMFQLSMQIERLAHSCRELALGALSYAKLNEIISGREAVALSAPRIEFGNLRCPAVQMKNVRFSYADGPEIFSGIDFDVNLGEVVAVVGQSGCGKSTLWRLLTGFHEPTSGYIFINGRKLAPHTSNNSGIIGVMTQDSFLFNQTISDNIYLSGDRSASIDDIISRASIDKLIYSTPGGLDAVVGEKGAKFSGGEKQRIAFARILKYDPIISIFDEPTASLDSHTEQHIIRDILTPHPMRAKIIITHNLKCAAGANRILFIKNGTISEHGTHGDLLSKRGDYYHMWSYFR